MSAHCYNNIRRKQVNEPPGKLKNSFHVRLLRYITGKVVYRVSQNSRIPNSERGREGPSGGRKILRKKNRSSSKNCFTLLFSTIIYIINNNKYCIFQPVFEENALQRMHLQTIVSLWGESRFFLISIFGLLK
jgi:hypothetical protein